MNGRLSVPGMVVEATSTNGGSLCVTGSASTPRPSVSVIWKFSMTSSSIDMVRSRSSWISSM